MKGGRDLLANAPDAPDGLQIRALGRGDQGGVTGVHAGILDMLADRIRQQVAVTGYPVEFDLLGVLDELADDHGMLARYIDGLSQEALQFGVVRGHRHGGAAEHVGRPHEHRVARLVREGLGFLDRAELAPFGLVDPEPVQKRGELVAVLRLVDALRMRAQHSHPGLVQLESQCVGGLPAHGHDDPEWLLPFINFADRLEGQLLEVETVALVVVGTDGFGVVVDKNGLVAEAA